jgi:hypothetical protein
MCFELLGNLHTNLDNGVENLKIRPRGDNRCESAKGLIGIYRLSPSAKHLFPICPTPCNKAGYMYDS